MYPTNLPREFGLIKSFLVILSNPLTLFGSIFICVGLLFFFIFSQGILNYAKFKVLSLESTTTTVIATIESVNNTSTTINDSRVYEYEISYIVNNIQYKNSFKDHKLKLEEGHTINIEVVENNPNVFVLNSEFLKNFDLSYLFILLFPLIGSIVFIASIKNGLFTISLYKNGEFSEATLTNFEKTNTRINNKPLYKMYFKTKSNYTGSGDVLITGHLPMEVSLDNLKVSFDIAKLKEMGESYKKLELDVLEKLKKEKFNILYLGNKGILLDNSSPFTLQHGEIILNKNFWTGQSLIIIVFLAIFLISFFSIVLISIIKT